MEKQLNATYQNNDQKLKEGATSPSVKTPIKPNVNYWKVSTIILAFLLAISLVTNVKVYENKPKYNSSNETKPTATETQKPQPTKTPYSEPSLPSTKATPINGKSYGVFYPFGDGVTINNNLPTVIGKVSQSKDVYLATQFGIEKSPVSGEDEYFLRFTPGRVKNLKVKIDGVEIGDVFGTPQYPTVLCKNINLNPDGTSTYDPKTGKKSPPDDIFSTENDCLTNKESDIPPLVFFAKTKTPLSEGEHALTLEGKDNYQSMTFLVDSDYHLPSQHIYVVDKSSEHYYLKQYPLIAGDNCCEGYYYDSNYLKIPLPSFNNPNLYYGVSFPQSKSELGSVNRRKVQIAFGNEKFDLFFPQGSIYYEGKSFYNRNNILSPYHQLFLPKDQLVFSDGSKASYVDDSVFFSGGIYLSGYFEIFPTDIAGGEYRGFSIPWVISGSSSCDG